jgi:predicted unusual protein kinase regulating ubiquinone biosynthesis (AarF/ABC1/UbiB family)
MPMPRDIPTSRFVRTTRLGRLAAGQAVRDLGARAGAVGRSRAERERLSEQRAIQAADQIVTVLGSMKGAAMKLGQMLSVIEIGMVPAAHREDFQRKLAALRDSAPSVSFADMRRVLEADLGTRIGRAFAEFYEQPIASASIGQVYRARLADGRAVAVKVQYPGIATAVRADLKNLRLVMRMAKRFWPGLAVGPLSEELRARISEELDYRREASTQQEVSAAFRGHPFIAVPDSVPELCGERVLVTEYAEGIGFDAIAAASPEVRDRVGEIVYRFYCGSMYRDGRFPGDPHPGNLKLQPDGRVAFLDFGFFKRMEPEAVELELAVQRAAAEQQADEVHAVLAAAGVIPEPGLVEPVEVLAYIQDAVGWYLADAEIEATPELATEAFIASVDPRSPHFRTLRWQHLPPEHALARRAELYTFGLLGHLRARANWHRITREWLYDDEPVTELGKQEAEFRQATRPGS